MLFDLNHPQELLTPPIHHGGFNRFNSIFTSSDLYSLDDNNDYLPSITPEENENEVAPTNNDNDYQQQQQQQEEDLFLTFDFPVLTELDKTESQIDALQYEDDVTQASLLTDGQNSLICDDSTFNWVAEECTIESNNPEDMMVPLSPPVSSPSLSPGLPKKKSTRKPSLSTIERKIRKKGQNKTAAEKYRLKKRTERNDLISRHAFLKDQNQELKYEMKNLSFQLEQFKQLFVDVLRIPIPPNQSK